MIYDSSLILYIKSGKLKSEKFIGSIIVKFSEDIRILISFSQFLITRNNKKNSRVKKK